MRTVEDIDGCIQQCVIAELPSCVSLTEAKQSPYWMYHLDDDMKLKSFVQNDEIMNRRQDLSKVYVLNGAVYVAESRFIIEHKSFLTEETAGYIMSEEHSMDIDTELDFSFCEWLIKKKNA